MGALYKRDSTKPLRNFLKMYLYNMHIFQILPRSGEDRLFESAEDLENDEYGSLVRAGSQLSLQGPSRYILVF